MSPDITDEQRRRWEEEALKANRMAEEFKRQAEKEREKRHGF